MERNNKAIRILPLITGIVGIVCGLAWIAFGIFDAAFPKPLTIAFAVCNMVNAVAIIINQRYFSRQKDADSKKKDER